MGETGGRLSAAGGDASSRVWRALELAGTRRAHGRAHGRAPLNGQSARHLCQQRARAAKMHACERVRAGSVSRLACTLARALERAGTGGALLSMGSQLPRLCQQESACSQDPVGPMYARGVWHYQKTWQHMC
jgi:hypothetical protein